MNNAGIMLIARLALWKVDEWERTMDRNIDRFADARGHRFE